MDMRRERGCSRRRIPGALLAALALSTVLVPPGRSGAGSLRHSQGTQEQVVDVVVRLRDDAASAFRAAAPGGGGETAALADLLGRFGVELKPMHPGIADPDLGSYFVISAVAPPRAAEIASALRALGSVEAAYVQPRPAPA